MAEIYLLTLAQFLICLILQIGIWRTLRRPDDTVPFQILWLFGLFLGGPLLLAFLFGADTAILALGLGTAYIMTFPAVSAKSPSIWLLQMLAENGPMSREEMHRQLNQQAAVVEDRLRDLASDGLIDSSQTVFQPSLAGLFLGHVFLTYRRLLGLAIGEG